jgi:hypothetical protein
VQSTWDLIAQDQARRVSEQLDALVGDGRLNPMAPVEGLQAFEAHLDQLDLDVTLEEYAYSVAQLVGRKQKDYGPRAINDAPGGPLNGINVRLHDKLQRAINLGTHPAQNESIFDTYMDIAGYALIAMLYLDGQWPA